MAVPRRQQVPRIAQDEWLGGESHVSNLSELRRRDRRSWNLALPWIAGGLLFTGLLLGSAATWALCRPRRSAKVAPRR